jgi:hypothetical protein
VQSAAIAVLVVQGRLPRPERIVMADTGREATATWKWLDEVIQPYLGTVGLRVEIAPHSLARFDMFSPTGGRRPVMPVFNDTGGKLPNQCSGVWKREVVERFLRREGYGIKRPLIDWIGISTDEILRAKPSPTRWCKIHYPLIWDVPMRRSECVQLVRSARLGTPPRSSCKCCPHHGDPEWHNLQDNWPDDFKEACLEDERIREKGVAGKLYLHRSCKPLSDVKFKDMEAQGAFDFCEEGRCEF